MEVVHRTQEGNSVYVADSTFGVWFLSTGIWSTHVLTRAINDLDRLIPDRKPRYPVIVDAGCGWGHAFGPLHKRYSPRHFIAVDADQRMLAAAVTQAGRRGFSVECRNENLSRLSISNESADMVFCHQTFHHIVDQKAALSEFCRILKPGGLLLFAESTRAYIHSWIIRLLFKHDMLVQRSAAEYLEMISSSGFHVHPAAISYPYLWWSRSDLGLLEHVFGVTPPVTREETLINLVAVKI